MARAKGEARKEEATRKERGEGRRERGEGKRERRSSPPGHSFLTVVLAVCALLSALLIGTVHAIKRARRLARSRPAVDEEASGPAWVVSERTILLASGCFLVLILATSFAVAFGGRLRREWRVRREARRERMEAAEAARMKASMRESEKIVRKVKKEELASLEERGRREQAEFEEGLLSEVEQMRRAEAEKVRRRVREREEESAAAQREAARIDEETRRAIVDEGQRKEEWRGEEWEEGECEGTEGEEGGGGGDDLDLWDEGGGEGEGEEVLGVRMALESGPSTGGTRISLEALQLTPAATARPEALWAVLGCSRCSEASEVVLSGLVASACHKKAWCAKCGALLSASLRPQLLTDSDGFNVLGHIDLLNCVLLDISRLSVLMQCGRCDAELRLPELIRGRTVHAGCRGCHAPLSLHMNNVQLSVIGGGRGGRARGAAADDEDEMEQLLKKLRKKNLDQFKTLGLVVGKPLPNKGTCRHFAHSYRWLRFPCCGRAHPCATCHAASDCPAADQAVWATRMLCGKCAREMPYSDSPCAHCGNTFTKPGGSHWQGGAGCRDQQALSCRDSRKHKGISASGAKKTTCAKSSRVGVQGKKLTAARSAAKGA